MHIQYKTWQLKLIKLISDVIIFKYMQFTEIINLFININKKINCIIKHISAVKIIFVLMLDNTASFHQFCDERLYIVFF